MGRINVVIVDTTGNKEQKVGLPDDVRVGIILVKLVEKIKLPSVGPDGNPISYKFIHKVSGKQLLETQSLQEANIKDGDVLRLQPEITAGAHCPQCGQALDGNEKFCNGCGLSFSAAPALSQKINAQQNQYQAVSSGFYQNNTATTSKEKKKGIIPALIVLILGLICSAVLFFVGIDLSGLSSVSGTSVAESYYNSMGGAMIGLSFLSTAFSVFMATMIRKCGKE